MLATAANVHVKKEEEGVGLRKGLRKGCFVHLKNYEANSVKGKK